MTAAYLDAASGAAVPGGLAVTARNAAQWETITAMARRGVSSPLTSSAGRLFDAVAALVGVRDAISYEGQAAVELEQLADLSELSGYQVPVLTASDQVIVDGPALVRSAALDLAAGVAPALISARFHHGVTAATAATCAAVRERSGLDTVALSGGVFQNQLLATGVIAGLEAAGFRVLTHRRVPCNDGGISFGQAAVAAATDRLGQR